MPQPDIIVIGTGGIGSAALWHLARRGVRVLGLDRFPVAHARGSSHGQTRLIRQAYYEHADYVPLLQRAYALWRELERQVERPLLVESGLVMAGPPEGAVIAGALDSARQHRLAVEHLTGIEAGRRWPMFHGPDGWDVVFEPTGGYLHVEACVEAHAEAARRAGAVLEHDVVVHGWTAATSGVTVYTSRGTWQADRLVLSPGAWAEGLLQLPEVPLQVLRKPLFWFTPTGSRAQNFSVGACPCFAFDTPEGFFYGFPALDGRGVKIAEHTGGDPVDDPLAVNRSLQGDDLARVDQFRHRHLPQLQGDCSGHAACLYTMSPDQHFVVGCHPRHAQVVLAAGFSGHGFKFASVMGEVLADLATTGSTPHPIGFLSPTRF